MLSLDIMSKRVMIFLPNACNCLDNDWSPLDVGTEYLSLKKMRFFVSEIISRTERLGQNQVMPN